MSYNGDLFERVKAIPIDLVIREYFPSLNLKRLGHDLVATCPFHSEDTPSFHVHIEKNTWRCFGACAKGGSAIDLLLMGELASKPLDAAKTIARKFGNDTGNERPKRKTKVLTVAQYADFCALPESFLVEKFSLVNGESGVEIPYRNEQGEIISVQRRHKLEKDRKKDQRFTWRKGDKILPYGLWLLPAFRDQSTRLVVVEGASDVHVLTHCNIAALGIPGAGNFKPEMASSLVQFPEIALIQEPGAAGEKFVTNIVAGLKSAEYRGVVKAVVLVEKDPRALWLTCKDAAQFNETFNRAIEAAAPIDLYPPIPLTRGLIEELAALFRRHVFFKEGRWPLLLAVWVIGTYLFRLFTHYPYLHFTSPTPRCGKTLLLDVVSQVAADPTPILSNASEAVIFRLADKGSTMFLDELDTLRNQDKEKFGAIIGLLNAGFRAGAKVPRAQKVENRFEVVYFGAYCPKVFAGLSSLTDTLEDRSLKLMMSRKTKAEHVERFNVRKQGKALEELRARLKLWAGERQKDVTDIYDVIDELVAVESKGLDDRLLDIIEPLLSIALFSDCEYSNGRGQITTELCGLFKEMAQAKGEIADDSTLAGLVRTLEACLKTDPEAADVFVHSADLLAKAQDELPWIDSARKLSGQLKKFGLRSRTSNDGKAKGYSVRRDSVKELRARYLSTPAAVYPSYRRDDNENKDLGQLSIRRDDKATTDEKTR
jgi:hypothetical protein